MKKAFIILSSGILLFCSVTITGCGGNNADQEANKETETEAPQAQASTEPDPAIQEGLELIGKSDCLTCHKLNEPLIGPAYSAVAERYANNPTGRDSLHHKIITGGAGNWGQIPMTAHPDLPEEDAKKMVAYIMSVKPE